MNAQEAIEYIHSFFWKGSIPGLGRTQELLRRMGNPEKKLKFVHIAGTNGKGSTAAMTASILQKAGYKAGLYTSPYIYRFNERIQVNGEQIADEDVATVTEYVKQFAEAMEEKPTEFELVTAIGFEYFARQNCDIVVLEVGMGGALDSTNVIDTPEVAVITNIGLDHTDYLGDTVEKIAETKAGIFKKNGHAVVYRGTPGVEAVYERICAERNISLKKADFDSLNLRSHSLEGQVFDCGSRKELFLPLLGDHQLHNASVVLSIADTLKEIGWNISEQNIREGIRDVSWPGRFDIVGRDPLFIIDGGHNPQCIDALVVNIRDYLQDRKIIALTGVLADKDYGEMYRPMMPYIQEFVCITPPNPRKLEATELAEHLRRVGATATPCETIAQGVQTAIAKAGKDGVVLCFGSLYTIGDIKNALN
jgi:dihydrofolate synthase/folylpolyglutamate synthase